MRPKTYTIDRPQAAAVTDYFSAGLESSINTHDVDYTMPAGSYSYPVTLINNSAEDWSTFSATLIGTDIYNNPLEETVSLTIATGTATTTNQFKKISRITTDITGSSGLDIEVGFSIATKVQNGIPVNWRGRNIAVTGVAGTGATYTVEFSYANIKETPVWIAVNDTNLVTATDTQYGEFDVVPTMVRSVLTVVGTADSKLVISTTDV